MGGLSERIMDAWLKRNPRPDIVPDEWVYNFATIKAMLQLGAYESAVMQFLVKDKWVKAHFGKGAIVSLGELGGWRPMIKDVDGSTFTEALLNAIEAIDAAC